MGRLAIKVEMVKLKSTTRELHDIDLLTTTQLIRLMRWLMLIRQHYRFKQVVNVQRRVLLLLLLIDSFRLTSEIRNIKHESDNLKQQVNSSETGS